ncbi:uncharacterized protein SAPINGB_P002849 [Magnusiomyces paraingens]|uniref:Structural maintenance of chromosomes protein 5 n=1 Tax=Magnusiomyces paraingens TaxID=2606893 RepID=A0A5E8BGB5_9ASCO|nr:uncharacterized protein SAPINGB_P002849 [Saprochaete ingens]VVT50694.1 unnamed protein product [Saprochaete ingens]
MTVNNGAEYYGVSVKNSDIENTYADPDTQNDTVNGQDYRSPDGYEPGAIRRIVLIDFVTYRHAEFSIGPSLNMIIGPNGSGKSTIVCAICLGLGGKPEILGRSKLPSQFIKHGASSATITIELQGFEGESNWLVTRTITGNNSSWKINNRHATQSEIFKTVERFNIQINNLCQFLPQDRVANFAQLPSTDLLIETERAVGERTLIEQHRKLIELDQERNSDQGSLDAEKKILAEKEKLQAHDQAIIEKIEERKRNIARSHVLNAGLQAIEYREARESVTKSKQQIKVLEDRYEALRERAQFFEEKKEDYNNIALQISQEQSQLRHERTSVKDEINNQMDQISIALSDITKVSQKIKILQDTQKRKKKEKLNLENELNAIENMIKTLPVPDESELVRINEESSQCKESIRSIEDQINGLENKKNLLRRKKDKFKRDLANLSAELHQLESDQQMRMVFLRNQREDIWVNVYRAAEWLENNRDKFKERIYLPPILSLTYKYPDMLQFLNANIDKVSMATFTALNRDDYLRFGELVSDELKINVPIKEFSGTDRATLAQQDVFYSPDELKGYGLDGTVLDLIMGPKPVLNMLCHNCKINQTPYSSKLLTEQQMEYIDSATKHNGDPIFTKYMDPEFLCTSVRSNYGNRNVSFSKVALAKTPNYFIASGQNRDQIKRIKEDMENINASIKELDDDNSNCDEQMGELRRQSLPLLDTQRNLTARRQQLWEVKKQIRMAEEKRNIVQDKIKRFVDHVPEQEFDDLENDLQSRIQYIAELTNGFSDPLDTQIFISKKHETNLVELDSVNNASECYDRFTRTGLAELEEQLQYEKNALAELTHKFKAAKHAVKESRKELDDDQLAQVKEIHDNVGITAQSLQEELATIEMDLKSSTDHLSDSTISRFEKRQVEIDALREIVIKLEKKSKLFNSEIEKIRDEWEPELRRIVSTISDAFTQAFKRINCRGEVRLGHTDGPFSEWSIDIMVSFRQGTDLQVLTHQLQSGGERAVSTIFYLISLQRITKSPFRVVDEINQGMDPRNERVVHSHMVHVACEENSSQYFLVTPKLLQDLDYHPKMKVQFIFSGNKVVDISEYEHPPTRFPYILQKARERNRAAAMAGGE